MLLTICFDQSLAMKCAVVPSFIVPKLLISLSDSTKYTHRNTVTLTASTHTEGLLQASHAMIEGTRTPTSHNDKSSLILNTKLTIR